MKSYCYNATKYCYRKREILQKIEIWQMTMNMICEHDLWHAGWISPESEIGPGDAGPNFIRYCLCVWKCFLYGH